MLVPAQMNLIAYQGQQNLQQGVGSVRDRFNVARDEARYNRDFNKFINGDGGTSRFKLPSFSARGLFR